ncbi:MAG: hypothetical protein K8S18_12840 [Desulfobacula sp.]|nr:hypothetical protein [Desulfobacula sp.]
MNNEATSAGICKNCKKPVNEEQTYCSQCIIELAEEQISVEEEEALVLKQPKKTRLKMVISCLFVLICIIIIVIQTPKIISAVKEDKPVRNGTYETDIQTDECIKNLWQISKLLQERKLPGKTIVCPASKKIYVVTRTGNNRVVSCPDPELHGLKTIRVSKASPCPEIRK